MVNVDLKTTTARPASAASTDFSLIVMMFLTVITLAVWGWLYWQKSTLIKDIKNKDAAISSEITKLSRPETKKVMDFQNRLKASASLVEERNIVDSILGEVEAKIVSNVYINSLSYDKGVATTAVVAKDFTVLAKQISSFKTSSIFTEVSTGSAKVNSAGSVEATISLKIN